MTADALRADTTSLDQAVAYAIRAETEDPTVFNQLVALQDAEYKLAGFIKQFQWRFGSTLCCHGAIGLWRRDVLGQKVLPRCWRTPPRGDGEDDEADDMRRSCIHTTRSFTARTCTWGCCCTACARTTPSWYLQVRRGMPPAFRGKRSSPDCGMAAGSVVPTFAPEKLLILFRQRVTSWDLCAQRKFMTQVKVRARCRRVALAFFPSPPPVLAQEFLLGWCNTRTLILKPFILQEVITVVLDWVRLYLVVGLAHRNPVGLLLIFFVSFGLLYLQSLVRRAAA